MRRASCSDADQPAWSPNGRRLAFTRGGSVYTIRVDGDDERRLAPGAHPAWSPNGERIALDRDDTIVTLRWDGGGVRTAGTGSDPAYAPDGRLAVVRDGEIVAGGRIVDEGTEPAWSADGKHVAYVRDDTIYVDGQRGASRRTARLATGQARAGAPAGLRPAAPDRPADRRRRRALAARLHVARRQHRPRPEHRRGRSPVRRDAHDRHAARPARERQEPHLPRRRADPVHELAAAPPLAPDALRLVRAPHARRTDARARPQERLLPRRPLGRSHPGTGRTASLTSSATASSSTRTRRTC